MNQKMLQFAVVLAVTGLCLPPCPGAESKVASITVRADKPGTRINSALWGIFFEDINFAADGGLYAEMVKNRAFEFPDVMMGWVKISSADADGAIEVRDDDPFHAANPHYLRLRSGGVSNEGFRGMGVRQGEGYTFSAWLRAVEGQPSLRIALVAANGRPLGEARLNGFEDQWKKYAARLTVSATEPKARLEVRVEGAGTLDLDMVSLFPEKTWKGRAGGLRADLAQMIADLQPGFIKFPGGFLTEGRSLDTRYQWKATIGDVAERKTRASVWSGVPSRPAPDYFQSFGLGFFEYFRLCEDLGAEPQPMVNCGMAGRTAAPLDQLDPYIQDALDLVEFANGPADSPWGKKRADMGHPRPFNLKMIRVGNENVGPDYVERFRRIAAALKAKYPQIQVIAGAGPDPAGSSFNFAWDRLGQGEADIIDEHSHNQPLWFFSNAGRFDTYDRRRAKVMVGEYCAHSEPGLFNVNNRSTLQTALSEAAFMTGLERNADVVTMSSVCAFLAHADAWQWVPNLIWFDNLRAYGTPSYYALQMFSRNRGDVVLPVNVQTPQTDSGPKGGMIGVGTWATQAEFKDIQVTEGDQILFSCDFAEGTNGWNLVGEGDWGTQGGVLRQNGAATPTRALVRGQTWTDGTYSLKARKLGGAEGFLIVFNAQTENDKYWWNLGGFGNTQHCLEMNGIIAQVPGSIETGRWYDIRIERKGTQVDCFLDGRLVQTARLPVLRVEPLYASASRDNTAGEIILKVVNTLAASLETDVRLDGVEQVASHTTALCLTSASMADENSFENPVKVASQTVPLTVTGPRFKYAFPANSLTVLRIKSEKE